MFTYNCSCCLQQCTLTMLLVSNAKFAVPFYIYGVGCPNLLRNVTNFNIFKAIYTKFLLALKE